MFPIQWFCDSAGLHIWFRSIVNFRKLSALLFGSFLIELSFLRIIFPENLNNHLKDKKSKKHFQTVWDFTIF